MPNVHDGTRKKSCEAKITRCHVVVRIIAIDALCDFICPQVNQNHVGVKSVLGETMLGKDLLTEKIHESNFQVLHVMFLY